MPKEASVVAYDPMLAASISKAEGAASSSAPLGHSLRSPQAVGDFVVGHSAPTGSRPRVRGKRADQVKAAKACKREFYEAQEMGWDWIHRNISPKLYLPRVAFEGASNVDLRFWGSFAALCQFHRAYDIYATVWDYSAQFRHFVRQHGIPNAGLNSHAAQHICISVAPIAAESLREKLRRPEPRERTIGLSRGAASSRAPQAPSSEFASSPNARTATPPGTAQRWRPSRGAERARARSRLGKEEVQAGLRVPQGVLAHRPVLRTPRVILVPNSERPKGFQPQRMMKDPKSSNNNPTTQSQLSPPTTPTDVVLIISSDEEEQQVPNREVHLDEQTSEEEQGEEGLPSPDPGPEGEGAAEGAPQEEEGKKEQATEHDPLSMRSRASRLAAPSSNRNRSRSSPRAPQHANKPSASKRKFQRPTDILSCPAQLFVRNQCSSNWRH